MEDQDQIAEPGPTIRRGWRRKGSIETFETSTQRTERDEPRIINTLHQKPESEPGPPYWRSEAAQKKAAEAQARADQANAELEAIEDRYRDQERDLAALKQTVRSKMKDLDGFRQRLAALDPPALKERLTLAFFRHNNFRGDPMIRDEFNEAGNLMANCKVLRVMLQGKIEDTEREIGTAEAAATALEKELGEETEAASIE